MNWGTKLMIGMASFMIFIIVLATLMIRSSDDDLVDKNYYEKGINYDLDYTKKENVKRYASEPEILIDGNLLVITFIQPAEGKLRLIRTADKKLDRVYPLQMDSLNQMRVPISGMASGLWKVQLDWKSDGQLFLHEKGVMLK